MIPVGGAAPRRVLVVVLVVVCMCMWLYMSSRGTPSSLPLPDVASWVSPPPRGKHVVYVASARPRARDAGRASPSSRSTDVTVCNAAPSDTLTW